jgi:two-component system CheB/CheR fusion protein
LSLPALVREAVGAMQPEADAKGVTLVIDIDTSVHNVEADSVRLQQIIWNLLHNAIKFTPQNGTVSVRLRPEGNQAKLEVEDTGAGIHSEFLPHVFGMFRQADASKTRRYGGMGIGLALVRQLAELHGGRVEAASAGPGQGARFTVWLPCDSAAREGTSDAPERTETEPALAGLRVLVVDDTRDVAEMLGRMLQLEGAEVVLATSASEALARGKEATFDVVLSDVAMPEMDGCDLLRELRSRPRTAAVPAIALTGFGRQVEVDATRAAGFALHLVKPVQRRELVDAVRHALTSHAAIGRDDRTTS